MTPGLAGLSASDVAELLGLAWLLVPGGFFGGWLYLRVRTLHENLF